MPALRVRVESAPPLPPLKAWFPLSEDQYETVMDLQAELCTRLNVSYSEIVLMLDGYELFAGSAIRDVIRDGELIVARSALKPSKRLAEPEPERPRKRAKLLPAAPKPAVLALKAAPAASSSSSSSSSSASSSSSSSSDSSSDDSSSDADDSSDSDSDSTSSSDSGPSILPATKRAPKAALTTVVTPKPKPTTPLVPPGHGKPSTQSRNARRRKKREFERVAQSAPIAGASAANSTPLGAHIAGSAPPAAPLPTTVAEMDVDGPGYPIANGEQPDMLSFSNKNKRRGFKRAMASIPPQRITFDDDTVLAAGPSSTPASRPPSPTKPPRLIPPSEKAALGQLPPGMFVTSVDVEAGMWPTKTFDKKRKKKQRDTWGTDEGHDDAQHRQELEYIPAAREQAAQEGEWDGALPYGDGEEDPGGVRGFMKLLGDVSGLGEKDVKEEMLDWADLERRFEGAQPVAAEGLQVGSVVAWKEFGVHPVRLTPEMVVHAATIEAIDPASGKVSIRAAHREATFGMAEEEGELQIAEYELSALGQLGWKCL